MPLHTVVHASIEGEYRKSTDLSQAVYPIRRAASIVIKDGTGTGRADILFDDERTIAASANEDLDLAGVLADAFGRIVTAVRVKAIEMSADATNTNNVVIGGSASNQFVGFFGAGTHTVALNPGGRFVIADPGDGWVVTPGTGDLLRVANSGAGSAVKYRIKIIAASA